MPRCDFCKHWEPPHRIRDISDEGGSLASCYECTPRQFEWDVLPVPRRQIPMGVEVDHRFGEKLCISKVTAYAAVWFSLQLWAWFESILYTFRYDPGPRHGVIEISGTLPAKTIEEIEVMLEGYFDEAPRVERTERNEVVVWELALTDATYPIDVEIRLKRVG